MPKRKIQTFNDGTASIYQVGNIAAPGNKPKDGLILRKYGLRYAERTVGMTRYWAAQQAQAQIDLVIRCHKVGGVSVQDVAVLGGEQYDIKQIQYPQDVSPPCMDLSLERREAKYDID